MPLERHASDSQRAAQAGSRRPYMIWGTGGEGSTSAALSASLVGRFGDLARDDDSGRIVSAEVIVRLTAQELIRHLGLKPLPIEGGYFRETYRAEDSVPASALPARYGSSRPAGSAIYFLLTAEPDCFSALHRLATDEIYHFYLGDAVELLLLHPGGRSERIVLGADVLGGQSLQLVVPRDVWQGLRLVAGGSFALLGTTMAPGFDPADFVIGQREDLLQSYPAQAELIRKLTRV